MERDFLFFIFGLIAGSLVLEPIVINFVYMSSPDLFNDIILTRMSSEKLRKFYKELNQFENADKEIWGDDCD